jgi:cellobiose transport system permease protein
MSSISQVALPRKESVERTGIRSKGKWRMYLPLYFSIAPYFILFLVFGITPTIFSAYLAFQNWDGIGAMRFVGFGNFAFVLSDPVFGQAVLNTFEIWFMSTIPMLFIALVLAFLINQRGRSKFAYQMTYFIPNITSIVAITLIFSSLFTPQYGLIDQGITALHLPSIQWMTDPWSMRWAISLMVIWRWTGSNAIIYMAGLQSIPTEFYEAARLDGAATWQIFRYITVPLLRPVILFTVVTSSIGGLGLFTEPQVLFGNGGGVGHEGLTMALYQYSQAFASDRFGFGAAISWVIFFIMLAFTILNWRIVQRDQR